MPEPEIGSVPFNEAIEHFRNKKLVPTKFWDDMVGEQHARAFTIAGATNLDMLSDFHTEILRISNEGGTLADFKKQFPEIAKKYGWSYNGKPGWRSRVIFETNLRTSRAAGRWEQITRRQRALQARRPNETLYLIYSTAGDLRVRASHRAWHHTVLPVDDPFWNTHYPPNGWGCRCIVRVTSRRGLDREGLKVTKAPEVSFKDRINRKTGQVYLDQTPGIDTGWNHNVGKAAWFPDTAKYTDEILGHQAAVLTVTSSQFAKLVAGKVTGIATVGYLDDTLRASIGAKTRGVTLSDETLAKQKRSHPDLTTDEYKLIPDMIRDGLVIKESDQVLLFFHDVDRLYRAVVKATSTGKGIFLTSFHRSNIANVKQARKRGTVLREEK